MPVVAQQPEIQCPGQNTIEMRWCVSKAWEQSNEALIHKLPSEILKQWRMATQVVCATAYDAYKQGSIYPQMVIGCDDRLNRTLLEELKGLEEWMVA